LAIVITGNSLASYVNLQNNKIYNDISKSVRRLSTGLRINNAADDPAGFAVSELMRADLSTLNQGERNLNDAISLVQTASEALLNINTQLIKMKELAEQASTATYTDEQRLLMQSEFSSLGAEIDRISNETNYNNIKLLDGSLQATKNRQTNSGWTEANEGLLVHFGTKSDRNSDYYFISLPKSDSNEIFSNSIPSIDSQTSAQSALTSIDSAMIKTTNFQSYLGGIQNRLESSLDSTSTKKINMQSSYETITDIDIANEMSLYISSLVRNEISLAMMAQANILQQQALKLMVFN